MVLFGHIDSMTNHPDEVLQRLHASLLVAKESVHSPFLNDFTSPLATIAITSHSLTPPLYMLVYQ